MSRVDSSRSRIALREFGKSLSADRRLKGCGRRIRRGNVGAADEVLDTTIYCGRAWLCPVCGHHAAQSQSAGLANNLQTWATLGGGAVGFLTLTQQHDVIDELDLLWHRLDEGWDALVRGSGWRADKEAFGLRGFFRITEVVHSPQHGWNVHFHAALLFDHALDDDQLGGLKERLTARFTHGVEKVGGQALRFGQDLRRMTPGSERHLARYCTKGTRVRWSGESRTPLAILTDLKETGEGIDLWKEFGNTVTMAKRRRYSTSQHLDKLLALP
jgi:hypothetical protein